MQWVDSSVEFIDSIDAKTIITTCERALRTCYRSENLIKEGSAEGLIRNCIKQGHESWMEHEKITYRVVCDRGVSHEWVRHRNTAYSQESTRYCNYSKDKFGNELTFVRPYWMQVPLDANTALLAAQMSALFQYIETNYMEMMAAGVKPDSARAILPNALKTELVISMNIRELRHFLKLRTTKFAHADIRKLAIELYDKLNAAGLGIFFEDIEVYRENV